MSDGAEGVLEKVTAFVTREGAAGRELLLFRHPHAGVQLPAGTVEAGEPPERAALREVWEEARLDIGGVAHYLGCQVDALPEGTYAVLHPTKVYARPDPASFDWAEFRRGIWVEAAGRQAAGYVQVTYREWDRFPDPAYATYLITGWVPERALCRRARRHFYHLIFAGQTPQRWARRADHHRFELFWAPLGALPALVAPQCDWLVYGLAQGLEVCWEASGEQRE